MKFYSICLLFLCLLPIKINTNLEKSNDITCNITNTCRDDSAYSFVLGDSIYQMEVRERELQRVASLHQRSQTSYGESYTGGEAQVIGYSNEQCVIYAKRKSGISRSIGYAGYAQTQGTTPQAGAIGIEKNKVGHAVYIEEVMVDKVRISEANYFKGKITTRVLSTNQIRGYIYY